MKIQKINITNVCKNISNFSLGVLRFCIMATKPILWGKGIIKIYEWWVWIYKWLKYIFIAGIVNKFK